MRKECHGAEEAFTLLKEPGFVEMAKDAEGPAMLPPGGLSAAKLQYLEKEIAEYLLDGSQPPWRAE